MAGEARGDVLLEKSLNRVQHIRLVGNNTFILKELMGHGKISTTEIYCQPSAPALVMTLPEFDAQLRAG